MCRSVVVAVVLKESLRDAQDSPDGALQVRLRLDGREYFINRLGRFDDPVAQARGQSICAEIWRDAQQGDMDLFLYRCRPLVEGQDQDLLDTLLQKGRKGCVEV